MGTSGWVSGADGHPPFLHRPRVLTWIVFAIAGLAFMVVNAATRLDDFVAQGHTINSWEPWIWEATSLLSWLLLLPLVIAVTDRIAALSVPRRIALHCLALVPVSVCHTALMILLRRLIYALGETAYEAGVSLPGVFFYEMRKDALTYAAVIAGYLLVSRLLASERSQNTHEVVIEVRDGSTTAMLRPGEIDWVAAAGNYVEIHGAQGTLLARKSLNWMERELGSSGFIRIHRSRLVRKEVIANVTVRQSGDFDLLLRSGDTLGGSRRYRSRIGQGS